MNTNETQEIEIPTEGEWDVSVQGAERRGYRAGVEAVKNIAQSMMPHPLLVGTTISAAGEKKLLERLIQKADALLAEQEKKE